MTTEAAMIDDDQINTNDYNIDEDSFASANSEDNSLHEVMANMKQTNFHQDAVTPSLNENIKDKIEERKSEDELDIDTKKNDIHGSILKQNSKYGQKFTNTIVSTGSISEIDSPSASIPRNVERVSRTTVSVSMTSYNRSYGAGKGNRPHDLLEYPPLYFLLKRFPSLLEKLRSVYNVRWSMTYPLQRRFPFARYTRKIGLVLSYGEVLLVIPFFAFAIMGLVTSFGRSSVSQSGEYARLPLIFAFLTATHNSLLTFLLGIPFERAIWYHKLSGRLALLNGLWHTYVAFVPPEDDVLSDHSWTGENTNFGKFLFDGSVNSAGTLILFLCLSMSLWSIPYIRRVFFEVFYYTHIIFAITMSGCAFYHSGVLIPILVGLLWGGDMVMRKLLMAWFCYPHKAEVKNLTRNVVEISFPKTTGFNYNPGQYMFLCIPKISYFQWHPFSISSSPHQDEVTFHIRTRGAWTKELHKYAESNDSLTILMEGPYGSLSVDLISERYKLVMLLSGGIGVTPMQSICHQLMYEYEIGAREMEKIWFLWTARDPEILNNMDVSVHGSSRYSQSMNVSMNGSRAGNASMKRSMNGSRAGKALKVDDTSVQLELLEKMSKGRAALTDYNTAADSKPKQTPKITSSRLAHQLLVDMPRSHTSDRQLEEEIPIDDFFDTQEDEFHDALEVEEDENIRSMNEVSKRFDALSKSIGNLLSQVRTSSRRMSSSGSVTEEAPKKSLEMTQVEEVRKSVLFTDSTNNSHNANESDHADVTEEALKKSLEMTQVEEVRKSVLFTDSTNDFHNSNESDHADTLLKEKDNEEDEVLSLEFFLTKNERPKNRSLLNPFVTDGRPDLKKKFIQMREDAVARGEKRVAVCVCAPQRLVDACKNACAKYSNKHVRFDFHCEVFD